MNIVKIFISLILSATSQFINSVKFPHRPVYISKWISDEHKESIYNAMDQLDLIETQNKTDNHIRIEYANYNGGGISMEAHSHTDGYFEVYKSIIGINRLLDPVMFQCVVLHELLHAAGLAHNENSQVMKPIINYTESFCYLDIEDIINLYNIGFYDVGISTSSYSRTND